MPQAPPTPGIGPLLGRVFGTILAVITPTYGGLAPGTVPVQFPWPGHGNNRDNSNPHIVYQFTFAPQAGDTRTPVLKYGISDEYRYGMDRPESQKAAFVAKYGTTVTLRILTRTNNRAEALAIEQDRVNTHQQVWQEMPREQKRPFPGF